MTSRIEQDEYPLGLRLVFGHQSPQRLRPLGDVKELLPALLHFRDRRQTVDTDVQVHAHLLLTQDRRPEGQTGGTNGSSRWNSSFCSPVGDFTRAHPPGTSSDQTDPRLSNRAGPHRTRRDAMHHGN